MLVDTHCHLYNKFFSNIDATLKEASNNNVNICISASDDIVSAKEMLSIAKRGRNIYICLGIHPDNLSDSYDELEQLVKNNLNNKKLVAIGEIGLDYYHTKENKEEQIKLFESQLSLAEKYNFPVVIHSREATLDTITCLKKYNVKGVIHCFNGSLETAKEYIKMGYKLGINGIITFKNCNLKDVIKQLNLENLVIETDTPFLTPEPFRKYSNEPKYIKVIAEFLANLFEVSIDEVAKITTKNVEEIFDIET